MIIRDYDGTLDGLYDTIWEMSLRVRRLETALNLNEKHLDSNLLPDIGDIGLTIRSYNALKRHGVYNVSQLIKIGPGGIAQMRHIGQKSYDDIISHLEIFEEWQNAWGGRKRYCKVKSTKIEDSEYEEE